LERLCGPLCDAVTGRTDGQAMLESLERANLFVVPLDEHRHWYRYHQLFADLLRARLGQRFPGAAAGLHRRAAAWYEQQGRLGDAVHHAQEAGDHELAARLIERVMEELIWWRSEGATLARWLAALPQDALCARPRLSLGRAIQCLVAGRLDEAATLAIVAERSCPTMADDCYAPTVSRSDSELVNVPAAIGFVHAAVAVLRGQAERAEQVARHAIAQLADEDRQLRAVLEVVPAEAAWLAGDLTRAEQVLDQFIAARQTEGHPQVATHALFDLGQVQLARGQLRAAAQTYRRGLALIAPPDRPPHPAAALQHLGLAEVLRQQGDLAAANSHASQGVELSQTFHSTQAMATGMATLAWIQFALNDHATARSTIAEAAEAVANTEVVALFNPVPSEQARLWLALGEFDDALRWVAERGLCDEDDLPYAREREYLVYARVLIAGDDPARALHLLHRLQVAAAAAGWQGSLVEVAVLQALALDAAGEPASALDAIAQALARAQAEGHVRVFADEGTPMGALLRKFIASARRGNVLTEDRALVDYAGRLLDAVLTAPDALGSIAVHTVAPLPGLVEPLTERECEVLMLLTAGKSNREIADVLVVSRDTVKKHLTHIFGKLGSSNRTQAVARARELGFLA
jgi:LuxR family maltose regulon positive regulatory protein